MKTIYIVPSFNCNLNCPHCDLYQLKDNYQEDKFLTTLNTLDATTMVLFGGEPLLHRDRFKKCLDTGKITSVSTNLLLLDDEYISLIKKHNLSIATSWNPNRFTKSQYKVWINNLKLLSQNNLSCIVLITLTEDLLTYDLKQLLSMFKELDKIGSIDGIMFEPLLDYEMQKDLHQRCDKWLCNLYDQWNFKFRNLIVEKLKNWNCDCGDVRTLLPNGTLKIGCPQYEKQFVLTECFTCPLVNKCKPCPLQHVCSFPKELDKKVSKCQNY